MSRVHQTFVVGLWLFNIYISDLMTEGDSHVMWDLGLWPAHQMVELQFSRTLMKFGTDKYKGYHLEGNSRRHQYKQGVIAWITAQLQSTGNVQWTPAQIQVNGFLALQKSMLDYSEEDNGWQIWRNYYPCLFSAGKDHMECWVSLGCPVSRMMLR